MGVTGQVLDSTWRNICSQSSSCEEEMMRRVGNMAGGDGALLFHVA